MIAAVFFRHVFSQRSDGFALGLQRCFVARTRDVDFQLNLHFGMQGKFYIMKPQKLNRTGQFDLLPVEGNAFFGRSIGNVAL